MSMTQEQKELLLKDLSARLPYSVKISVGNRIEKVDSVDVLDNVVGYSSFLCSDVEEVKPYLLPLSSMNEEQLKEMQEIIGNPNEACISVNTLGLELWLNPVGTDPAIWIDSVFEIQDWLNAHHFDFRGLIEKSLALDATNLNIY